MGQKLRQKEGVETADEIWMAVGSGRWQYCIMGVSEEACLAPGTPPAAAESRRQIGAVLVAYREPGMAWASCCRRHCYSNSHISTQLIDNALYIYIVYYMGVRRERESDYINCCSFL